MIRRFLLLCLVLVLMLGASLPAYAATEFDAYMLRNSSSQTWTGAAGSHSVSSGTYIAVLMQQLLVYLGLDLDAIDTHISNIYTRLGSVVTSLSNIDSTLTSSSTTLSNIYTALNVTLKNILDGAASSLTSIDTKLNTSNSRLSSIISNQGTIYNYLSSGDLQVSLDSEVESTIAGILSNTDDISLHSNSIFDTLSSFYASSSYIFTRNTYNSDIFSNLSSMNLGSFAFPLRNRTSNSSYPTNYHFEYLAPSKVTLLDALESISISSNFINSLLMSPGTSYTYRYYDSTDNSMKLMRDSNGRGIMALSVADLIYDANNTIFSYLGKLQFFLADDDSIQLKLDNSDLASGIYDDFSGSGSNAASLSDVQLLSSGASDLKDSVSGVSASGVFGVLSDGDSWGWFSNAVKNDMDTVPSSNSQVRVLRSSRSSDRSFSLSLYDQYYSDLYDLLGLNGD